MARIYIDAWCVKRDASGMGRYARALIPALAAAAPQHEFIILRPASYRGQPPLADAAATQVREVFVHRPTADAATLVARPFLEPAFRRFGRADVYHSLFHLLPIGIRRGRFAPRRIVVSLHDLIWIDRDPRAERHRIEAEWLRRFGGIAIPYALRMADHVICGSNATSNRAAGWVPPDRRTTVYYGIDASWLRPPAAVDTGSPYVAAFGVPKAYKNIQALIRALPLVRQHHPGLRLVLIGGDGGTAGQIRSAGLTDHVSVRAHVDDAEVRALSSCRRWSKDSACRRSKPWRSARRWSCRILTRCAK
jgi:glycosyltransferase involved in cell wall biosynthesis